VRNSHDINAMSVPIKFREIGDFHEYYSGARRAPYLTLFVGGNHEASNHLFELYHGGWVAPNIYYLGAANVIRFGPLRISGISGIWKRFDYNKPHFERIPYNDDDIKSIYHVREYDVRKLLQIRTQVDIGISHDWPQGIEWKGDWRALFRAKDSFEADARCGELGSPAAKSVLDRLRTPYWFAAHLHCKYSAIIEWPGPDRNIQDQAGQPDRIVPSTIASVSNTDEIDLDMDDDDEIAKPIQAAVSTNEVSQSLIHDPEEDSSVSESLRSQLPPSFAKRTTMQKSGTLPVPAAIGNRTTRFLALDKCLPRRQFLQLLEVKPVTPELGHGYKLSYDKEWLAITRVFANKDILREVPPDNGEEYYRPLIEKEEAWVQENIVAKELMEVPHNFQITAPVYDPDVSITTREGPREYTSPQTTAFCNLLDIPNPFHQSDAERTARMEQGARPPRPRTDRGRGGGKGHFGGRSRGRVRGRGFR
jgi:lariat debranching enzyme